MRREVAAALRREREDGAGAGIEEKTEVGARKGKRGRRKARGKDRVRFHNSKHVT